MNSDQLENGYRLPPQFNNGHSIQDPLMEGSRQFQQVNTGQMNSNQLENGSRLPSQFNNGQNNRDPLINGYRPHQQVNPGQMNRGHLGGHLTLPSQQNESSGTCSYVTPEQGSFAPPSQYDESGRWSSVHRRQSSVPERRMTDSEHQLMQQLMQGPIDLDLDISGIGTVERPRGFRASSPIEIASSSSSSSSTCHGGTAIHTATEVRSENFSSEFELKPTPTHHSIRSTPIQPLQHIQQGKSNCDIIFYCM